jgi:hypothetical protein
VSSLLAAVDPRGESPFERERAAGPERATLPTMLESFAEVVLPETTALLATLAERLPGHELTAVIYIDHNLGTVVKDAFDGAPVEADVAGMQRVLDGSLVSWLNHLKNAAEAAG